MSARETLVLTRADVASLMRPADWLEAVETAFGAAGDSGASRHTAPSASRASTT